MANNTETPDVSQTESGSPNFVALFSIVSLILSLICNGGMLAVFLAERHLWLPFNVYLVNILVGNFVHVILNRPFSILKAYRFSFYTDAFSCAFHTYSNILLGVTLNAHVLIAFDRVWATAWPGSYRRHSSNGTAIFGCIAVWAYVHALTLPALVEDVMYRISSWSYECRQIPGATRMYAILQQVSVYDSALLFMCLAYPYVFYNWRETHRLVNSHTAQASVHLSEGTIAKREMFRGYGRGSRTTESSFMLRDLSHSFAIQTSLTISMVVIWTPTLVYFTGELITEWLNRTLYVTATTIYTLQTIVDPVILFVELKELRISFLRRIY